MLLLEPTPQFYREKGDEDKRLKFSGLVQYLRPYRSYLVQLALAMLTASVLSLILPFLTQSVVDKGIGTNNLSFVVMMLVAQVVLTLGQLANNLIRSWLMLHMTTRISISLISDFLAKLMRLPIAFFDSKMVGDIMQRIREKTLEKFKKGEIKVLVATDVAARGLDIDDVDAVFNFEVPEENEYYIHRIGRTGRARKHGVAYTLLSDFPSRMRLDDIARNTRSQIIPAVLGEDGQVTPAENKSK